VRKVWLTEVHILVQKLYGSSPYIFASTPYLYTRTRTIMLFQTNDEI